MFRVRISALAAVVVAAPLFAQSPSQAAFVYLSGTDTIGVERFLRSPDRIVGEIVMRGQPRIMYDAAMPAPGRVNTISLTAFAPNAAADAPPMQRATMRLQGDSVIAEITAGGTTRTQRFASKPDALLLINASMAGFEPAIDRARAARTAPGDSIEVPVFLVAGGQTISAIVRVVSDDSVVVRMASMETHVATDDGKMRRVRVPAQSLIAERVEGPAVAKLSLGKPDYSAPAGAPYTAQPVTVKTQAGHVLAGTLTMPTGASGRMPAVVTITGSGPQDRDEYLPIVPGFRPFRQVADTLGRRGIAVLRLDDRGTGESGGDHSKATSADFADDIRAAVAWLRARADIDPAKIALLGHSEGGLIAPIVAAADPKLAGIVLLAGPSKRGRPIIEFQLRNGIMNDSSIPAAKKDSALAATKAGFDTTAGRTAWMKYFLDYDPLTTASKVKVPVLILQGATDQQVTADQAEELAEAIRKGGNRNVTVRVYPDRNHLFLEDKSGIPAGYARLPSGKIGPEVMGEIAEWLAKRLGK